MTSRTRLDRLRAQARAATLSDLTTLPEAVYRLGFVQADPIRAPARAQDLILRNRVKGYRAGDLERQFARLGLEEDFLYAYGFMTPETRQLLHPRADPLKEAGVHTPTGLAADVLNFVRENGPTHPRDLEVRFGRERAVNGWGGYSKATTRALESLHHYGLLRVTHRRDGIRIYACSPPREVGMEPGDRAARAVMLVVSILAPISLVSLRGALTLVSRRNPGFGPLAPVVAAALRSGELEREVIDRETYVWPACENGGRDGSTLRDVRLLAPFDPVVWDRRRFEHLWGWAYRFEAYTPPPRRQFGYYALPILWGDRVIGWANVALADGDLHVTLGYAQGVPSSQVFYRGLDAEIARMQRFLKSRDVP